MCHRRGWRCASCRGRSEWGTLLAQLPHLAFGAYIQSFSGDVVEIATTKLYTDHATDATIVRPVSFGCGAIVMTEQNQSRSDERSDGHAV